MECDFCLLRLLFALYITYTDNYSTYKTGSRHSNPENVLSEQRICRTSYEQMTQCRRNFITAETFFHFHQIEQIFPIRSL